MIESKEWVEIPFRGRKQSENKWFALYYTPCEQDQIRISEHTGGAYDSPRPNLPHTAKEQLLWVQGASRLAAKASAWENILRMPDYKALRAAGLSLRRPTNKRRKARR